ncbi:hypothetical protein ABK040_012865 [Willaertia magna]
MAKTGIELTQEGVQAFLRAYQDDQEQTRWLQIQIQSDMDTPVMEVIKIQSTQSTYDKDLATVQNAITETQPCYFLFRLDSKSEQQQSNYEWILIWYVPDKAKVREKMLYSSSIAGLKNQIQFSQNFVGDYYASNKEDLDIKNFKFTHKSEKYNHDVELYTEQERQKLLETSVNEDVSSTPLMVKSGGGVHGVEFPLEQPAVSAIHNFVNGSSAMIVLKIDPEKECILLAYEHSHSGSISVEELKENISETEPRYIFFHFEYENEEVSETARKIVFVYCCPTKAKVKQRMLASASKQHVLQQVLGIGKIEKVEASVEISDASDLSHEFLVTWIHPPKQSQEKKFNKPKRPGRGTARVATDKQQ